MPDKQRGVTLIGWILLLIPTALIAYAAIRLTPVYLNYMKVVHSLNEVKGEYKAGEASSAGAIRTAIGKHFDIESVDYPTLKDVKISRDGQQWTVEAAYDDQAPLFSNMFILVSFDKTVTFGEAGGG